jgi:hypothetical protein
MLSVSTIIYSTFGLLTINMLNGIITGTTNTLKTIYNLLPSTDPNLIKYKHQIELMDIEFKLKIIQNWLINNENSVNTDFNNYKNEVGDLCIKISNSLDEINNKISYHNTKWFCSWRSLDLNSEIDILKNNTTILNNRIQFYNLINTETVTIKQNIIGRKRCNTYS